MPPHFDACLVNGPFDDPGLYVDLGFQRRALLFDLGEISSLSTRKLLRVSDVFVSHRHMDHFGGFDVLLRRLLGRQKTIDIYGPEGMIDAVQGKLQAYTWNLIASYEEVLSFRVTEILSSGSKSALFNGGAGFKRSPSESVCNQSGGVVLTEPDLLVRAAFLDHGIPVLAFALEQRARINVWRNQLQALGLATGPWLQTFKQAIFCGEPDNTEIKVAWLSGAAHAPATLPLGFLKNSIMKITAGSKLCYVTDCAYTDRNIETIIRLAKDSDILFIEATFLHSDAEVAAARRHLTAKQAGRLARLANAKRLVTFHYSPRYRGDGARLNEEAQRAFHETSDRETPCLRPLE